MKFSVMIICVFFINAIGQTAQANTNSDGIFYDHDVMNTPSGSTLRTHDQSGMKHFGYFEDKRAVLASTSHRPRSTRGEISEIDTGGNVGWAAGSNPILTYFDKLVSWIKDTYRARVAKDNYGATRLLLLSFGLIGLLGIRRKLKRSRSAHISSEKEHWILGKDKKDWILKKN